MAETSTSRFIALSAYSAASVLGRRLREGIERECPSPQCHRPRQENDPRWIALRAVNRLAAFPLFAPARSKSTPHGPRARVKLAHQHISSFDGCEKPLTIIRPRGRPPSDTPSGKGIGKIGGTCLNKATVFTVAVFQPISVGTVSGKRCTRTAKRRGLVCRTSSLSLANIACQGKS